MLPEVPNQGEHINIFDRYFKTHISIIATATGSLPNTYPISGFITGSQKSVPFYKGLQHINFMAIFFPPIQTDSATYPG